MTLTANASWRLGGVPQPGVVYAHNAYCYRCPFGLTYPDCNVKCAQDAEDLIRTTTSGRIAGFIAEPIQGVGGFITPPREYFGIVADIVRKYGGIFISDEVQTAWGRTGGKWFGIEQYGVTPDIITSAKGLGNGFPIGLTVAKPEVADAVKGATISTFGGNPMAATAGKAVLEYIEEQKSPRQRRQKLARTCRNRLLELQEKHLADRRSARYGVNAGDQEPGRGPQDQSSRVRCHDAVDGSDAGEPHHGWQRRPLRQCDAHHAPAQYRQPTDVDEFAKLLDRSFAQCRVAASV